MKKRKMTTLALMLGTALVSATLGGALLHTVQTAAETTTSANVQLSRIFETSGGTILAVKASENPLERVARYQLPNGGSVKFKRDLALKWYTGKDEAKYASVSFAFEDVNFTEVTLSMDTTSAWATEDEKTTNVVKFKKTDSGLEVTVNPDNEGALTQTIAYTANTKLTLQLQEDATTDGAFKVAVTKEGDAANFDALNAFTNIGANYAKYLAKNDYPLNFTAKTENEQKTVLCVYDVNGQQFTGVDSNNAVADTVAPVLVVNETFDGLVLGSKFTFSEGDDDYKIIDVLQDSNLTKKLKAYQYNPTKTIEAGKEKEAYFDLTTSTIFYETSYQKADSTWTTVYAETPDKEEFVSVYFDLSDDAGKQADYFLSWYASDVTTEVPVEVVVDGSTRTAPAGGDWISLNQKESAPYYKTYTEEAKNGFQNALNEQAATKYAGSNEEMQIPSLKWLIDDNNGYRAMKFTISYYTPSSTAGSPSTLSSLDFNKLEIPVATEGTYEFKVFATDTAGNAMMHDLDGKEVKITASNIWDMDDIPSFKFTITDRGLKVEEPSSSKLKETQVMDKTYTLSSSDMKVVGASNLKKAYKLYKVDFSKFDSLQVSDLTSVTYAELAAKVNEMSGLTKENAHEKYLRAYAELIVSKKSLSTTEVQKVIDCFAEITEYGDTVHGFEKWDKYEWNPDSVSFKTAEEGEYLILADFWEGERTEYRAAAYKLVVVESKGYQTVGEDNWLQDNVVSVVLFGVAGVMLILIVVLLMVKPSNETLEDVERKAAKKAKKERKAEQAEEAENAEENEDEE